MYERNYAVYILASARNGALYAGVTNNRALRVHQQKSGMDS
jgi:predicted GIY-YIG superfamily endonuclease